MAAQVFDKMERFDSTKDDLHEFLRLVLINEAADCCTKTTNNGKRAHKLAHRNALLKLLPRYVISKLEEWQEQGVPETDTFAAKPWDHRDPDRMASFRHIVDALLSTFCGQDEIDDAKLDLKSLHMGTDFDVHVEAFQALMKRANYNPDDERTVDDFKASLNGELHEKLRAESQTSLLLQAQAIEANTFEEVVAKAKKIHNDLKRKAKVVGLSSPYPAPRGATRRGTVGGAAIAAVMGESEEDEEIPIAAAVGEAAWVRKLQDDTISRIKKEVTDPLTRHQARDRGGPHRLHQHERCTSRCAREGTSPDSAVSVGAIATVRVVASSRPRAESGMASSQGVSTSASRSSSSRPGQDASVSAQPTAAGALAGSTAIAQGRGHEFHHQGKVP